MDSALLELYKEMHNTIQESSRREWETVKFYSTIFLAFLTATVTIITFSKSQNSSFPKIFISILPVYMFCISWIGLRNFSRECRRLWERVATLAKIEEELGFRIPRAGDNLVFKDDEYYLPKAHIEIDKDVKGNKTTENFVNQLLKLKSPLAREKGSSYSNHVLLFYLYIFISLVLLVITLIGI